MVNGKGKSPRYDADYDALQCAVRNASACRACANRIAFMGKRGEKGAWNKACQGVNKPAANGKGRRRSSYGGSTTTLLSLDTPEAVDDDLRPLTPEPEPEPKAPTSTPTLQNVDTGDSIEDPTETPRSEMSL